MTTPPKISIVTPSLNYGAFIEDAILSVLEQGYPNVEHIIVDGGSKDNTLEVLKRYPHVRWISEPDNGQSDALNKGFRMATGDLVGWLNADEYYFPCSLQAVADFASAHSDADVLYGDSMDVDEEGRILRCKTGHRFFYPILLYYGCYIATDSVFFRRSLFDRRLFIDVNYRIVMDYEYFVRLARSGLRFAYLRRFVGTFRWHSSNVSSDATKRRRERLQVQRTWSQLQLPDAGYDALANTFHFQRILLKIINRNYVRELRVSRSRGENTRWFCLPEAALKCAGLIK